MVSLSIIVPTCGRPSLKRTLDSCLVQMTPDDRIIVVGDGPQPASEELCTSVDERIIYLDGPLTKCYGHKQRQVGLPVAAEDYVVFMDDDDVFTPGALQVIRDAAGRWPGRPMLFQFIDKNGAVIWQRPELRQGNVGTPCIVLPNKPELFGTWGDRYEGDYDFIRSTVDRWPGGEQAIAWRPNIVADCRPVRSRL